MQKVQAGMPERPSRRSDELNAALREIASARDIGPFSRAVVRYSKQLRKQDDLSEFLQTAAARFDARFVAQLEENIRSSWGYATTCNAVSREAGGEAGIQACRSLAVRVSRLDKTLMKQMNPSTLSLFASSFGRHPTAAECREAVVNIAEFCCDESFAFQELQSQSLALLVNGFGKWPAEESCGQATAAIAREVCSARLSEYTPQNLGNLVNGFSKWPDRPHCAQAAGLLAGEICRRAACNNGLCDFNQQGLSNLVNGFGKWPDDRCGRAIVAIAKEIVARADQLPDFTSQALANLVNGFRKWPEEDDCRRATAAIADEVIRRAQNNELGGLVAQDLANLVNGFSKWPNEAACRKATVEIGIELCRRAALDASLSDFWPQHLSNLVNGFSKWPEESILARAAGVIGAVLCRRASRADGLSDFTPQHLANLVNGFVKWPEETRCNEAILAIADEVVRADASRLSSLAPQLLENLVSGFSSRPEETCRRATVKMADEILSRADREGQFPALGLRSLANLVNGFGKWPEQCRDVAVAIAKEVLARKEELSACDPQALALLVSGFSNWPKETICRDVTVAIANEIAAREEGLSDFDSQGLATLANGLIKWADEVDSSSAKIAIAREVIARADLLPTFTASEVTSLFNAFCNWPETEDCLKAADFIATELCRRVSRDDKLVGFAPRHLALLANAFGKRPMGELNSRQAVVAIAEAFYSRADDLSILTYRHVTAAVNGFSKWPEENACLRATGLIAAELRRRAVSDGGLPDLTPPQLASLVNGFSKWPEDEDTGQAIFALASELVRRGAAGLSHFNDWQLAVLINGLSKWPTAEVYLQVARLIANELCHRAARLPDFTEQYLGMLMNGFSKWPEEAACHRAVVDIARGLGRGGHWFGAFTTPQLRMIANALGRSITRGEDAGEIIETALLKDRLHQLAHHLHYANDRLEYSDVLTIAAIFKALAKARLIEDLGLLAPIGLDRLNQLLRAPEFAAENNLETMGNLCAALVPLARSPHLRWHRRQALYLLNDVQPILEQKIEAHFNASKAERIRGPLASRGPALSVYQVLKARAVLATMFKRPDVEGKSSDLRMRQQELQRGTRKILASTRDLIQGDLSNMSWNMIAQIEADSPIDALDTFVEQNAATIRDKYPAAIFDVHEVLRAMDHDPRPPQGEAGLMRLPVVDMQGRPLPTEPETRYSIFNRLTSGAIEVVAVQLPAKPSAFMLARTFTYKGVPYRMDLFGGSKLKAAKRTLSEIAAHAPGAPAAAPSGGKLLAVPYAETAPGTSFEKLLRAWAPFKEAYWYTQRRGFAAPPAIKDLGPHDNVLEGAFRLLLTPDRPISEAHPFKLTGPEGPIALRPHDGCGFIKASLAERMLAVRRAGPQEGPDRMPAYGEGRRSSVPAAALQHYPRSERVAEEAREMTKTWLESRGGESLIGEQLFRAVTAGHIDGPGAVAVPSSDNDLHVPKGKSETLTQTGGVLIGRSPYDKPNLRPLAAERVKLAADGDPTAAFLDRCVAVQYSFSVAQKSREELAPDDPSFFAKGILIVVPDEMWPANYADRGLVMSAEDVKCHSSWTERKDGAKVDTALDCVGILQATEVFAPGSLVAVPTGEQKKLDGDFDGDTVVIIGDRPQLYEHVRQFDEKEQARGVRSLKPPKSYTPAIEGNNYQFSRASQILAATRDALEIYTGLQRSFLAQSHEARRWFAERAIFGTYEGVHHELRRDISQLLNQEQVTGQDIEEKLDRARREIKAAYHPVAHELAELLATDLEAWAESAEEQVLPETAESVSDTKMTVSPAIAELFPNLPEAYQAATHPRDRIRVLLDNYPARIDPRPDGYIADDFVQSASNLLSLGIKVGTDAFKSDTSVELFIKKSQGLQRLLQQTPGVKPVPYVKSMAATLNHGRFNVDTTLEDLKDNPTLAASIMEASINLAAEKRILPVPFGRQPAEESAITLTLTREHASERAQIEAARAAAEEKEITAAALLIAGNLRQRGIQVNMPYLDHRLRTENSLRDQLMEMNDAFVGDGQPISNAVRHVFEVPDKDFARAFRQAILAFEEQGYAEISTTNWFKMSAPTFVGMKTVLATPDGYRFEAEFHTPGSYKAKITNHDTYKELQELQRLRRGDAPDSRKMEQLAQRAREVCKEVAIPEGVKNISHWSIEGAPTDGLRAAFGLRSAQQSRTLKPSAKEVVAALNGRPIVLVGMPGSGKSTIGSYLARRLGLPFIDSDKKIETAARMSITEIFETKGEQHFRELEARSIARVLESGPVVLATGGGAFMHEETRRHVADKAVSIWLNTDIAVIRKRLSRDTVRPLLQTASREDKIAQLIYEREPFYQLADLTVVPGQKRDNKNADQCVAALHAHLCGERLGQETG
ncbi:shikimate kinase [Bradyrhizobium zhanjiangense]|nr:shikimate kinase [Bradyrhizobium zhanjiangense]